MVIITQDDKVAAPEAATWPTIRVPTPRRPTPDVPGCYCQLPSAVQERRGVTRVAVMPFAATCCVWTATVGGTAALDDS